MNVLRPKFGELTSDTKIVLASLMAVITLIVMLSVQMHDQGDNRSESNSLLFRVEIVATIVVIIALSKTAALAISEIRQGRRVRVMEQEARVKVETLFEMTDMLQSAMTYADANAVLRATAAKLLDGFGGALYIFNNSGDRLDLSTAWNWPEDPLPAETIQPEQCWALKRGKPHINASGETALRCEHHATGLVNLEIPMLARGEVHGLFKVIFAGEDIDNRLREVTPLASAIADAMSLALSNIALREKLRTQALRDPLTGLYNRRYMEDMLDRFVNLGERNGGALSAIMIDLDHFKRLNDEHGHAIGDAVLSEVAAVIAGGIRPCDVACRYGGEELVVLLPDCDLSDASIKAEILRGRIESLSENRGVRITASLGVASVPDTSAKGGDLLSDADAALYQAKKNGRNRVAMALRRPGSIPTLNLAVSAH